MTDKQIMIDGVDVLNCGHYSQFEGETENACYIQQIRVIGSDVKIGFGSCNSSPNCYYKQLKRKEQENEEFKKYIPILDRLLKQFETYDKLKSLDVVAFVKQTFEQLDQLKAENEHLAEKEEEARYYLEEAKKYKQALQEIKEICNSVENIENVETLYDAALKGMYLQAKQILQKCEVIKDEE